jgi:hypothetical protein
MDVQTGDYFEHLKRYVHTDSDTFFPSRLQTDTHIYWKETASEEIFIDVLHAKKSFYNYIPTDSKQNMENFLPQNFTHLSLVVLTPVINLYIEIYSWNIF